jgi:hypothetical protein
MKTQTCQAEGMIPQQEKVQRIKNTVSEDFLNNLFNADQDE